MDAGLAIESYPRKGFALAVAGSASLASNFVTAKYALQGFNLVTFSFVWAGAAAVFSFGLLAATGRLQTIRMSRNAALQVTMMGFFTAIGMILSWAGLLHLDPAFAAFLRRFDPILAIGLGVVFLKERFKKKEIFPVILMISGGLAGSFGRWEIIGLGVMLTLLACLAIALQFFISRVSLKELGPMALVFYRSVIATAFIGCWVLFDGGADFHVAARYWLVTFIGALIAPIMGHYLLLKSYIYWDFSKSMVVFAMQPLFVLILAYVFLSQLPGPQGFIGGMIIISGVFWLSRIQAEPSRKT
jgi:drug/metabolite transporter (DMT)-like permease